MRRIINLALILCTLILIDEGSATILYVDDDAAGDPGPGNPSISDPLENGSLEHPFDAIQEAIDSAVTGDRVDVASGTYTGTGNHDLNLFGKRLTIQSLSGAQTTIIDCESVARGFLFNHGETTQTIIDGLTIQNGNAEVGGGIFCEKSSSTNSQSSPTIRNCRFISNFALNKGGAIACSESEPSISDSYFLSNLSLGMGDDNGGGAIWCSFADIDCERNTFEQNNADQGGAILVTQSAPTITGSTFISNQASNSGGAICCLAQSSPSFISNSFSGNISSNGGGSIAILDGCVSSLIFSCSFENNSTTGSGGAVLIGTSVTNSCITNTTFITNTATSNYLASAKGGAVYGEDDSITSISGCTFLSNSSENDGGALYLHRSSTLVVDCLLQQNNADYYGGGAYCDDHTPIFQRCRFVENAAENKGGGLFCGELGTPTVSDCRFLINESEGGGGIMTQGNLIIGDSFFDGCNALNVNSSGGAILSEGGSLVQLFNCLIVNCRVDLNGAGILGNNSAIEVKNCTIVGNTCASGNGAAIYSQGTSLFSLQNSVLFFNPPESIFVEAGAVTATYSNIEGGWSGEGNLNCDPQFISGIWGGYYLNHAGAVLRSPSCSIDHGSGNAGDFCYSHADAQTCMNERTTRVDHLKDSGIVDMGYHYPYQTPTPTPAPSPTPALTPIYSPTVICINNGDINNDHRLSAGDAQTAFHIAIGLITPTHDEFCSADCNNDWEVTAGDAQQIFESVVGLDHCADPL